MKRIIFLFAQFLFVSCSSNSSVVESIDSDQDDLKNITEQNEYGCSVLDNKDGSYSISCGNEVNFVLHDGKDGIDGVNGFDGKDGESCYVFANDSIDGYDVVCGGRNVGCILNGKNGLNGKDGRDGLDGKDGLNGLNGVDGKDGINCYVEDTLNFLTGQSGYKLLCGTEITGIVWNGKDGKDGEDGEDFVSKKEVSVCSKGCDYSNISKALRENQSNTVFRLSGEIYDVESAYKEEYGEDFFENYDGYIGRTDPMYRGLNLGIGCEIIGKPNSELQFLYSGDNPDVSQFFSILSLTDNNVVSGIKFNLGGKLRYAIHDDYSTLLTGSTNIVEHCVFSGMTSNPGRPYIGTGMGKNNAYIYRDCVFSGETRAIGLHNNSGYAMGRVEIYDCYAEGDIYIFHYGVSVDKTPVIIHGCRARNVELTWADKSVFPNENMQLFSWNNDVKNK